MGIRFFDPAGRWIGSGLMLLVAGVLPAADPPVATRTDVARREVQENRLRLVNEEIEKLRDRLSDQRREEKNLLDTLERLDMETRLQELELQELEDRISRTGLALVRNREEVAACEVRVQEEKEALAGWLRGMYTRGPAPFLALLLGARDTDQLLHAYRYASFLTRTEAERLERFRRTLLDLQEARTRLQEEEDRLARLREERERGRDSLRRTRREKREELERIRRQTGLVDRLVGELSATQSELRDLLGRLSAGGAGAGSPNLGMDRFKGFLDWPVEGEISVPFGERQHPRFGTVTPHPGVSLFVPEGREVRAVFDGMVVYSDWFRGYGNMVILDHGRGYLSIYAHTSRLLVDPSQEVLQGDVIAMTGKTGSLEGPQLYFEIREEGSPVDPAEWFRNR